MRRFVILGLGIVALVAAVLVAPRRDVETADDSLIGAIGRSAGGLRVLASDVLFLRAEQLRREGRIEEVPALYESIMRLEPTNPAAVEFLAGIQGYDLVSTASDEKTRLGWWTSAWDLLEGGRKLFPDDPSLMVRQADLLLDVPAEHPELAAALDARFDDRMLLGLELLLEAARRADALPRRGRHHLLMMSEAVPVVAASREARSREAVLALGDAVLSLRGGVLGEMLWVGSPDGKTLVQVPRSRYLAEGIETVRSFRAALEAGDVDRARAAVEAFETLAPEAVLAQVLRGLLEPP